MKERVLFRGKEFKRRNIGGGTRYWHRCDKLFDRQLRDGTLALYPRSMTFEVELRSDFYGWLGDAMRESISTGVPATPPKRYICSGCDRSFALEGLGSGSQVEIVEKGDELSLRYL